MLKDTEIELDESVTSQNTAATSESALYTNTSMTKGCTFLCLSFFPLWSSTRGCRVEEEEHPTMTAPAGRGQDTVKKCIKIPPLSVRGSGKAAAMALRAPCNGIQIKDNKQTKTTMGYTGASLSPPSHSA